MSESNDSQGLLGIPAEDFTDMFLNNQPQARPMYIGTDSLPAFERMREQQEALEVQRALTNVEDVLQIDENAGEERDRHFREMANTTLSDYLEEQERRRAEQLAAIDGLNTSTLQEASQTPLSNQVDSAKKVIFFGGPKDGQVQQIQHQHGEVECFIQPELPRVEMDNVEETLVIDDDGNKKWVSDYPVTEIPEPETFRYKIALFYIDSRNKFYGAYPAQIDDRVYSIRSNVEAVLHETNSSIDNIEYIRNQGVIIPEPEHPSYYGYSNGDAFTQLYGRASRNNGSDEEVNQNRLRGLADSATGMWNSIMNSVSSEGNNNNNDNAD